mgnify:FL=1
MKKIKIWFSIIRPKTLLLSFIPILLAVIYSWQDACWLNALAVICCGTGLQVLANLINDYYDFKSGLDKKGRVGPQRALAEGTITTKQMKNAIWINLIVCLLLGIYLVFLGGWTILCIGVLSICFAWLYTASRFSLSYLGIADIFAFVFYGPVATAGTYIILSQNYAWDSRFLGIVLIGCICGCVSSMVLLTNNLRDIEVDKNAGKKTIPVRFGKFVGEMEYLFFIVVIAVLVVVLFGWSVILLLPLLALMNFFQLLKAEGKEYNKLLFRTSLLNLVFLILYIINICVDKL